MAEALKSSRRRPQQQLQDPPLPESCSDTRWKHTLKANHQNLRLKVRMKDVLPGFRSFLTDVEYLQVKGSDKAGNIDQVDQLVEILLTKEKREFEKFLVVLLQEGQSNLAARLADEAGGRTTSDDVCVCIPLTVLLVFHCMVCVHSHL